jgi:thiamine-monophosphate kinase
VKVSDLGEFGLIERLTGMLPAGGSPDLIVGIGDDAAVWRVGDEYVIATTDAMVDGVHFLSERVGWTGIGWKAMAVNISDIAAMGGQPQIALVTLALPSETNFLRLQKLYEGMRDCALTSGTYIIGGDTVRAETLSISVTVLGRARRDDAGEPMLLRRDAARPGDAIAVTGELGDSAAGLRRLVEGCHGPDPFVFRHMHPPARLAEADTAVQLGVRCGIDVSDGLVQDVGHIGERSGVGATIRAADIPISDGLRAAYPDDALRLACTGGEDYELVLVGSPALIDALNIPLTVIGEIVDDPEHHVRLLDDAGNEITFERGGWDAFR